jgi:hypothetical protein
VNRLQPIVILASLLAVQPASACEPPIWDSPQVLVRRSSEVAEIVARAERDTYDVIRVWKGTPPATVVLPQTSSTCAVVAQFVPGQRYLALLHGDLPAEIASVDRAGALLRYLASPQAVAADDLLGMLRGWHGGTVTAKAMAHWLRELVPVADVDDWTEVDGKEVSPVLIMMLDLDMRVNSRGGVPLEALTCELDVLREQVVPAYVQMLTHPPRTQDDFDAMEVQYAELDGVEEELCQ